MKTMSRVSWVNGGKLVLYLILLLSNAQQFWLSLYDMIPPIACCHDHEIKEKEEPKNRPINQNEMESLPSIQNADHHFFQMASTVVSYFCHLIVMWWKWCDVMGVNDPVSLILLRRKEVIGWLWWSRREDFPNRQMTSIASPTSFLAFFLILAVASLVSEPSLYWFTHAPRQQEKRHQGVKMRWRQNNLLPFASASLC